MASVQRIYMILVWGLCIFSTVNAMSLLNTEDESGGRGAAQGNSSEWVLDSSAFGLAGLTGSGAEKAGVHTGGSPAPHLNPYLSSPDHPPKEKGDWGVVIWPLMIAIAGPVPVAVGRALCSGRGGGGGSGAGRSVEMQRMQRQAGASGEPALLEDAIGGGRDDAEISDGTLLGGPLGGSAGPLRGCARALHPLLLPLIRQAPTIRVVVPLSLALLSLCSLLAFLRAHDNPDDHDPEEAGGHLDGVFWPLLITSCFWGLFGPADKKRTDRVGEGGRNSPRRGGGSPGGMPSRSEPSSGGSSRGGSFRVGSGHVPFLWRNQMHFRRDPVQFVPET